MEHRSTGPILFRFRGKAQHEIEFNPCPASLEGQRRTVQDVFPRQAFIDDVPEPLAPRFRRKSQTAFFHVLHFAHDIQRKGVNPQRRKRYIDMFLLAFPQQKFQKFIQSGIVAGTQRAQGNFIISGISQHFCRVFFQDFDIPFPDRTV